MWNKDFLLAVDCYTGYLIEEQTRDKTPKMYISFISRIANKFGLPRKVRSDSGPAFIALFTWQCAGLFSAFSAYHLSSNDLIECNEGQLKDYLHKLGPVTGDELYEVVLEINSCRSSVSGVGSPVERLFAWTPRFSGIPSLEGRLPHIQQATMVKARQFLSKGKALRKAELLGKVWMLGTQSLFSTSVAGTGVYWQRWCLWEKGRMVSRGQSLCTVSMTKHSWSGT